MSNQADTSAQDAIERTEKENIDATRLRIIYISQSLIIRIFCDDPSDEPDCQYITKACLDLKGVKVINMFPDYARRAIAFVLQHESFDPVPPNVSIPDMEFNWRTMKIQIDPTFTK